MNSIKNINLNKAKGILYNVYIILNINEFNKNMN